MHTFRVAFVSDEKRELLVEADFVRTKDGSYEFVKSSLAVALAPLRHVLYVEKVKRD